MLIDKALIVMKIRLQADGMLKDHTLLELDDIMNLLNVCLKGTYFLYQGKYYLQIHRAVIKCPLSPIVCNLYVEYFKQKALATAEHLLDWWGRYMETHTQY